MAFTARTETYVDLASLTTPYNITVTKPTGTVDGNILFCWIGWATAVTIDSVPSGWTLLGEYIANIDRYALYYKVAASEGASWVWSFSGNCRVRAVCSCYTGGDFNSANPIDVVSNTAYRTENVNCIAASMTVSAVNSPLVFWGALCTGFVRTFTKPSVPTTGWIEDDDAGNSTTGFSVEVCSMIWSGSGATGAMSATMSAGLITKHAFAVALNPPAAGETLYGAATISGTGSLAAIGRVIRKGAATLSGVGILAVAGQTYTLAVCSLSGVGAVTVTGKRIFKGTASVSGIGALTVIGAAYTLGAAFLSGVGTLTAIGKRTRKAASSLTGIGVITASTSTYTLASASLSGIGTLTAVGEVITGEVIEGAASLAGAGVLTVSGKSLTLPVGITQTESNIEQTTATINGKISDDGGESCEARFRWRISGGQKYEYYDTGDDAYGGFYAEMWKGQTFTPSTSHKITSVKLKLSKSLSPGTITVSIRATAGGEPTGGDLCVGTTDGNTLPVHPTYEWREISLGNGYNLDANTMYAIVARVLNGDFSNHAHLRLDTTSPTYAGGTYTDSPDSGGQWMTDPWDIMFEEWSDWITTDWQNTLETDDTYYEDLTGLDSGIEYEYQTQAKNSLGEGEWSSSETFTTQAIIEGQASLSGIGTLSISAKLICSGKGSLDGVGNLSIIGKLVRSGVSSLTGVGSLTVAGATFTYASASLQGAGILTATATAGTEILGAASLEGIGLLSSLGSRILTGSSSLSGIGTLSITAYLIKASSVTLEGIGVLTASGLVTKYGESILEGVGLLIPTGSVDKFGCTSLEGIGILTSSAKLILVSISSLSGIGTLTITGEVTRSASVSLEGIGSLITSAYLTKSSGSVLTGVGTLTAEGQSGAGILGEADLDGIGTLTLLGSCIFAGISFLIGEGTLTIGGKLIKTASSSLEGAGSLAISAIVYKNGASSLTGVGTLETASQLILGGVSALEGVGILTAEGQLIGWIEAKASLEGIGTLTTSASLVLGGASSVEGVGLLTIIASQIWRGASTLVGVGSLGGAAVILKSGQVVLIGTGTLAILAGLLISARTSMTGIGILTAAWTEIITRHQDLIMAMPDRDLIMAMPDRDLIMAMPARGMTLKVREHE